ncbi:SPOR domain-containing protein [Sphingomonas sp. ASY06-1R]|uniref:SPOR domain-containing protein n=1 Tax=Sphingomonas sp. ASY06-1R TaxID=3445771 RepID=UPI003FA1F98A
MVEIRRGFGAEGMGNERLPWLEPVEDEDDYLEPAGGGGRLVMWIVIGIAAVAILFGAFVIWQRHRASQADIGQIIRAPAGPYKEKPANPGGLAVDESGVIAERMGTGNDIDSPLDLSKIPEQPMTGAGSDPSLTPTVPTPSAPTAGASPTPAPVAKPAAAKPAAPTPHATVPPVVASAPVVKAQPKPTTPKLPTPVVAPTPAPASGGGSTVQLGALASEAKARAVWKTLSSRFGVLAPLAVSITPVKVGDNTLYRLRASGGDARKVCAQLRVAGESCNVVD